MMGRWRPSLRTRLTAGAAGVILVFTLAYSLLILDRVRRAYDLEIEKRGQATLERLTGEAEFPMRAGDLETLEQMARDELEREEIHTVSFTVNGLGEARAAKPDGEDHRYLPLSAEVAPMTFRDDLDLVLPGDGGEPGEAIGTVSVKVCLAESDRVLGRIRAAMIVAAVSLALLAALVNLQMARRITRPLMEMLEGSRKIGEGDFNVRLAESHDEIGRVAAGFNKMAENLKITLDRVIQQEKMASIGRMASGITHEIGNPLNAILLQLGVILSRLPEGEDREKVLAIQAQARRMKEIVSRLLDYARTPSRQMAGLDLAAAVEAAIKVMAHPLAKNQIEVERDLAEDLPLVRGEKNMCIQVFVNLIANAIEAVGKGGKIAVRLEPSPDLETVRLSVGDNGPGVPDDCLESIFEPFYTTKPSGQGTGLGLAICRQIITGFGGRIWAERCGDSGCKMILEFRVFQEHGVNLSSR